MLVKQIKTLSPLYIHAKIYPVIGCVRLNKVIVQNFVGLDESMSMHKLYVYQQNTTTLPFMQTLCKENKGLWIANSWCKLHKTQERNKILFWILFIFYIIINLNKDIINKINCSILFSKVG